MRPKIFPAIAVAGGNTIARTPKYAAERIGCHTFRATGITDYLKNGGRIEVAQRLAGHSNSKTTGLCDRRNDDVSLDEVERSGIYACPANVLFV